MIVARHGTVWHSAARHGMAWHGTASLLVSLSPVLSCYIVRFVRFCSILFCFTLFYFVLLLDEGGGGGLASGCCISMTCFLHVLPLSKLAAGLPYLPMPGSNTATSTFFVLLVVVRSHDTSLPACPAGHAFQAHAAADTRGEYAAPDCDDCGFQE
jgi:hypothetical protein